MISVATRPPAPPRLATTPCSPRLIVSCCAAMRPRISAAPPGGNPTTSRTGLSGYRCACGAPVQAAPSITAAQHCIPRCDANGFLALLLTPHSSRRAAPGSVRRGAGNLDGFTPFLDLGLEKSGVLLRGVADELRAFRAHAVTYFRQSDDAHDFIMQPGDDLARRAGGNRNTKPRTGFKTPQALLVNGWNFGQCRHPLEAGHAERA